MAEPPGGAVSAGCGSTAFRGSAGRAGSLESVRSHIATTEDRLSASPSYREYRPPASLAGVIECFWTSEGDGTPTRPSEHRVLPDGRIDIVFQLGTLPGEGADRSERAYVVGPMRVPADIRYHGPASALGVRFQPGAARAFLAPPADALVDAVIDLGDVWRDAPFLVEEVAAARGSERVTRLARRLEARVRGTEAADPAAVALERSGGALTVADLVRATGLSERQLQRRFRERVGFPPRLARRIARFKRAVALLHAAPDTPWPRLLVACGFYDQPHLIREFRTFAGVTPVVYASHVGSVQDGADAASHSFPANGERRTS